MSCSAPPASSHLGPRLPRHELAPHYSEVQSCRVQGKEHRVGVQTDSPHAFESEEKKMPCCLKVLDENPSDTWFEPTDGTVGELAESGYRAWNYCRLPLLYPIVAAHRLQGSS